MKALITDTEIREPHLERHLLEAAGFEVSVAQCRSPEEVIAAGHDASALLVQYAPLTAEVFAALPQLRVVSRYGVGVDSFDLAAEGRHGVWVSNVPDYGHDEVPIHTLALLSAILRHVPFHGRKARGGVWAFQATGEIARVADLTLGIERARGNADAAAAIRAEAVRLVGDDLSRLKPGSAEAMRLKEVLIAQGAWSQYPEVGIGPDAKIFTKGPPMSALGTGMDAGLHRKSSWNNPAPEVVLAVSSAGRSVGAMLGNDVNLRDVGGRSALLLGKAKDNNAASVLGPLLRLFDESFSLDDVRQTTVTLVMEGEDGSRMEGASSIAQISRDPEDLVAKMIRSHHQYPNGAVLFLGTMFAPVADRGAPDKGFIHAMGDIVTIAASKLGALVNRMRSTDDCEPWTFGTIRLMRNLAGRGVLRAAPVLHPA